MIRERWIGFVLACLLVFASASATAGDALTIASPVDFKAGIMVSDAVKAECELLTKVPMYIKQFAEKTSSVKLAEGSIGKKGRVLRVTIEDVLVSGFGGPKALTIAGSLRENGKLIGTITARRTTMGGPFGAFTGVCGLLSRCAKTLGKDLAEWLEAPAMDVVKTN